MSRSGTFSQQLADLTSGRPSSAFDPDALEFGDGTSAGGSGYRQGGDDGSERESGSGSVEAGWGELRAAADMESMGHEYRGKKVSRKELAAESWGTGSAGSAKGRVQVEPGSSGEEGEVDAGDEGSFDEAIPSLDLDDVSSSSDDEEESEAEGIDRDGDAGVGGDGELTEQGSRIEEGDDEGDSDDGSEGVAQTSVFSRVKGNGVSSSMEERIDELYREDERAGKARKRTGEGELKRAKEALRQRQWWDSLLEVRILLQRLVNAANRLPGPNELPLYLDGDETLGALAAEGADLVQGLTRELSATRESHMAAWGIDGDDKQDHGEDGGAGEEDSADGNQAEGTGVGPEGLEVEDDERKAGRDHGRCMAWWEKVVGRWHERTQLVDPSLQRKFKVVNQGPWVQVMASLADEERAKRKAFMPLAQTDQFLGRKLAKRLRRTPTQSEGRASGHTASPHGGAEGSGDGQHERLESLDRHTTKDEQALDLEVLDDRDSYQHLLKEFMETSGGSSTGNGLSGAASVPVKRGSRKKAIDRRASKGRKIKYVTHPKMQNFMFPQEYPAPPMEPSELFSSLFGRASANPKRITS